MCKGKKDLWIENDEVVLTKQNGQTNVSVIVHSSNVSGSDVEVHIFTNPTLDLVNVTIPTLSAFSEYNISGLIDLSGKNYVNVWADASHKIDEVDEGNNKVEKSTQTKIKAYLEVKTVFPVIDTSITNYLENYVESVSQAQADIEIYIGRPRNVFTTPYQQNKYTLANLDWGYEKGSVRYENKIGNLPYNGIVGKYYNESKTRILVYGTRIEGTVAAVKELVEEGANFLDISNLQQDEETYLGKYDIEAIKVFDYLHTPENEIHYMKNTVQFGDIIENVLNEITYDLSVKRVKTLSTTSYGEETVLRLKNVNSDLGSNYKDYAGNKTVVLSRGIHSNLMTWHDFAKDLAEEDYDSWLIEMVGGPNTDEDCGVNCPNYTFSDLKTYYWPALIGGVQKYANTTNLSYVGYSIGCSAALEALEIYESGDSNIGYYDEGGSWVSMGISANPIDTFVGIACPNNMSDLPLIMALLNHSNKKYNLLTNLENNGKSHAKLDDIKREIMKHYSALSSVFPKTYMVIYFFDILNGNSMSTEVYREFLSWIDNSTGPDIGEGVTVNNLMVVQGKIKPNKFYSGLGINSDMIVPNKDTREVCQNVDSNNKYYVNFDNKLHMGPLEFSIANSDQFQKVIREYLANNKLITQRYIDDYVISTQQTCEP